MKVILKTETDLLLLKLWSRYNENKISRIENPQVSYRPETRTEIGVPERTHLYWVWMAVSS